MVQLAKILNVNHGFNCRILFAQDPNRPGIIDPNYKNNIPGLNKLVYADLTVMLIRFRALPDNQMQFIDDYLKCAKPVLGMRTETHAFNFNMRSSESSYKHYSNYYNEKTDWQGALAG